MQTNLLYPCKDPRGDGLQLHPFERGDNVPKGTWVEKCDLHPWQLAPEAVLRVPRYTASSWAEWPDKWRSCQLSTKEEVREAPISEVGPERGEGTHQCSTLRKHQLHVLHPSGPYPRTSRMKTRQLLTKMCLVRDLAAVPVTEHCNQFLYINKEPVHPTPQNITHQRHNVEICRWGTHAQSMYLCRRNWPGNLWMGFTLLFQKYLGRFQSKDFKPHVSLGHGMKVEELGIRLGCCLVMKNKWT